MTEIQGQVKSVVKSVTTTIQLEVQQGFQAMSENAIKYLDESNEKMMNIIEQKMSEYVQENSRKEGDCQLTDKIGDVDSQEKPSRKRPAPLEIPDEDIEKSSNPSPESCGSLNSQELRQAEDLAKQILGIDESKSRVTQDSPESEDDEKVPVKVEKEKQKTTTNKPETIVIDDSDKKEDSEEEEESSSSSSTTGSSESEESESDDEDSWERESKDTAKEEKETEADPDEEAKPEEKDMEYESEEKTEEDKKTYNLRARTPGGLARRL